MKINIYLVEQDSVRGYDIYDSFVCYANNEEEAKHMHPAGDLNGKRIKIGYDYFGSGTWCNSNECKVTLLGSTFLKDIDKFDPVFICKSFRAG